MAKSEFHLQTAFLPYLSSWVGCESKQEGKRSRVPPMVRSRKKWSVGFGERINPEHAMSNDNRAKNR